MVCEPGVRRAPALRRGDGDSELVRAAQAGASGAYGALVSRYQNRIYTVVSGMVADREDALDLTQETFIKAYMALGSFRQEAGFYTWLYRIAVHRCIDYSRKRRRHQEPALIEDGLRHNPRLELEDTSPSRDPERAVMNLQLRAAIRAALQQLPEPFRTAVILRDIEGLSQEEIAKIMGCRHGTAKSRIQRGRCQLRDLLRSFVQPDG